MDILMLLLVLTIVGIVFKVVALGGLFASAEDVAFVGVLGSTVVLVVTLVILLVCIYEVGEGTLVITEVVQEASQYGSQAKGVGHRNVREAVQSETGYCQILLALPGR